MKDFDRWNKVKKKINLLNHKRYHPKQIWWCSLGLNIGYEQDGSGHSFNRPVIIVKTLSRSTCFIIPLTTSEDSDKNRISIGKVNDLPAKAILSQMRVIDTRRLTEKIGILEKDMFDKLRKALRGYF